MASKDKVVMRIGGEKICEITPLEIPGNYEYNTIDIEGHDGSMEGIDYVRLNGILFKRDPPIDMTTK